MQPTNTLKRTVTFFIKGNLTQVNVEANDPRSDREIIRELKSKRKASITNLRNWEHSMELTKDPTLPTSGKLYKVAAPSPTAFKETKNQEFITRLLTIKL